MIQSLFRKTEIVVFFVACHVENLLLSLYTNSSASTPLCAEYYSLIRIQEQPTARDLQSGSWHRVRDQTPALLERTVCRESLFRFFIKVFKDETRGRKNLLMPGTLGYL